MELKLHVKPEMDWSLYMQRLARPNGLLAEKSFGVGEPNGGFTDDEINLLSKICYFQQMGRAEYEYGRVPAVFRLFQDLAAKNQLACGVHWGVCYICPERYKGQVLGRIEIFTEDPRGRTLADRCTLAESLKKVREGNVSTEPPYDTVGWVEIDNGYMLFVDSDMFIAMIGYLEI